MAVERVPLKHGLVAELVLDDVDTEPAKPAVHGPACICVACASERNALQDQQRRKRKGKLL